MPIPAITPQVLSATGASAAEPKMPQDTYVLAEIFGTFTGLQFTFEGTTDANPSSSSNWFKVANVDKGTLNLNSGGTTLSPTDATPAAWMLEASGLTGVRMNVSQLTTNTVSFLCRSMTLSNAPQFVNSVGQSFPTNLGVAGTLTVTSGGASALTVGANGATNPALKVDASTGSSATGLQIKSAAAGAGVAETVISSGTNESWTMNAKGSGTITIGGTSTGIISVGRGSTSTTIFSSSKTSIATQNSTPTAAQLLGGYIAHASTTGAGTATLDTAANIDAAIAGVATGDAFECTYDNTGSQTVTITTNTGLSIKGTAAIGSGKNAILEFNRTGSAAWDVSVVVSA